MEQNILVIGIAGGTGSGKTTLMKNLITAFSDVVTVLSHDNYYKRHDELPYEGMMLTTVLAAAARKVRLENGPDFFDMELSGVAVGPVALLGIPGEPFNGIGRGIKEAEGWEVVMPCCLTNGSEGYFPMQDSYDEGGYEARSSRYKAGTAEIIIKEGVALMDSLR